MKSSDSIHIVDDDASIRKALSRLLHSAGFEVATYGSAEEYLGSVDDGDCGCLLLDLELPGMTGLDLQRELAERHMDVHLIGPQPAA